MTWKEFMLDVTGYEVKTTFWEDFSIADRFGLDAIRDTYKRALSDWKDNHIFLTELVLVLNHKIWYWHDKNEAIGRLYDELWRKADQYAMDHLKGDELQYYFETTD